MTDRLTEPPELLDAEATLGDLETAQTRRHDAYPVYRSSGVEWLGDVPEHWTMTKLKYLTKFVNGMAFKPEQWSDLGFPIIRIENLNGGGKFNHFDGQVPERYHVTKGDLLFGWSGNRGTSFGPFLWWRDGLHFLNQHIFKLHDYDCDQSWLHWTLRNLTTQIEEEAHGIIGMVHVTKGKLGATRVPAPPIDEQRKIARFLDEQTKKIDDLISAKRDLLALLREKRKAIITHAVTKGLDSKAKLKPSGVQWLGDVPEHWDVTPLYARYDAVLGKMLDEKRIVGEYLVPYLRNVDVQWDWINSSDLPQMDIDASEYERFTVRQGDLLVCEGGEVGRSAIWQEQLPLCGFQKALHRVRAKSLRDVPRFLFYVLVCAAEVGAFIAGSNPNTIPHLTGEKLRRHRFPAPPAEEQQEIAHFLDEQMRKMDELKSVIREAITSLELYRASLISAAVTGKIDVRGEEP